METKCEDSVRIMYLHGGGWMAEHCCKLRSRWERCQNVLQKTLDGAILLKTWPCLLSVSYRMLNNAIVRTIHFIYCVPHYKKSKSTVMTLVDRPRRFPEKSVTTMQTKQKRKNKNHSTYRNVSTVYVTGRRNQKVNGFCIRTKSCKKHKFSLLSAQTLCFQDLSLFDSTRDAQKKRRTMCLRLVMARNTASSVIIENIELEPSEVFTTYI